MEWYWDQTTKRIGIQHLGDIKTLLDEENSKTRKESFMIVRKIGNVTVYDDFKFSDSMNRLKI